ncbi:MAG: efflux RND transporter periplasmic adaptor subunit, partial [Candidatus Omnitrophica bacterium]|nr:efflux RND transporter periplasmic adaptor subunit [Candidatus Omnitrophota bacterium]
MMKNKRWRAYLILLAIIIAAVFLLKTKNKPSTEITREVKPLIGSIQTAITSTGTVQPQNRLEVKPPINGRIDKILVNEGETVKAGQTLALMSSTERAALLDAARARGPEEMKYWEDVYKPTQLIAPIDGEVIVSTDEPGQTVTSAEAVIVLSDKLIVQAQVDETDVGGVRVGQEAVISLDAYPKIKVNGKVDHIYYESKLVNNVTIYQVDIAPDTVPEVFRSGMSATVSIAEKTRDNAFLVPIEAVKRNKDGAYALISRGRGSKPEERKVEVGISDEKNIEIVSGLSEDDLVIVKTQKYTLSTAPKGGNNPLM